FEIAVSLSILIHGYFRFIVVRTHQLQAASDANESTQLYFLLLLTLEYAAHPLSLLAIYFTAEGALRSGAAFLTDEVVPSPPLSIAAHGSAWRKRKKEKAWRGPAIADHFERLQGTSDELRICSQLPKEGWRASITVAVEGEFYEIARIETDQDVRPFKYVL